MSRVSRGNSPRVSRTSLCPTRGGSEVAALHVSATSDFVRLDWNGTMYRNPGTVVTDFTTPVLQPGCGQLSFGYMFHLRHYAAVTAEKV